MFKRIALILAAVLVCGATAAGAVAQDQAAPERGQRPRRMPVVFGEILSIEGDVLTLKPEIPEFIVKTMEKRGREMPELPDQVQAKLTAETECFMAGKEAEASAFKVGDQVALVLGRADKGEVPVIRKLADIDTARLFIEDKLRELREAGGRGGPEGRGGPGGPGGPGGREGERQFRPVAGEITALTSDSLTIKPEIPQFMLDKLQERGIEPPADLPAEVVLGLGERTRFLVNSEKLDANPFKVGDKVAVLAGPGAGEQPVALAVCDYATAQARMEQMAERGPGEGRSPGGFSGERGAGGGPGSWGGHEGENPDGPLGPGGPGGPGENGRGGERRFRPVTGEIIAISADSLTIKPEIPDFVLAKMKAKGKEAPKDLPEQVVLAIGERTKYMVNSEEVDSNPFRVGDKVAVMSGPNKDGEPVAYVIGDYATAKARMEQKGERRGGEGERGAGRRDRGRQRGGNGDTAPAEK